MKGMELFILRHGIAVEKSRRRFPQDHERPLTPEGRQKVRAIARRMKAWRIRPDMILTSPLLRACQTAEIAAAGLGCAKKVQMTEHLAPQGDMKALMAQLVRTKPRPKRVLLVGHEPYLSHFMSILLTGKEDSRIELKKGGLGKLRLDGPKVGSRATLEWLLAPKTILAPA